MMEVEKSDELIIQDDRVGATISFALNERDEVTSVWIVYCRPRPLSDFINQGVVFRPEQPRPTESQRTGQAVGTQQVRPPPHPNPMGRPNPCGGGR